MFDWFKTKQCKHDNRINRLEKQVEQMAVIDGVVISGNGIGHYCKIKMTNKYLKINTFDVIMDSNMTLSTSEQAIKLLDRQYLIGLRDFLLKHFPLDNPKEGSNVTSET